jgi:hypothetical protein
MVFFHKNFRFKITENQCLFHSFHIFWHKLVSQCLRQGWPTQIGLWKKCPKNINFLGHILTKTERNHPKYQKITDFRSDFGPQKIFLGRGLATPGLRNNLRRKNIFLDPLHSPGQITSFTRKGNIRKLRNAFLTPLPHS